MPLFIVLIIPTQYTVKQKVLRVQKRIRRRNCMELMETAIYIVILRTYVYFEETGRTNSFERFPF